MSTCSIPPSPSDKSWLDNLQPRRSRDLSGNNSRTSFSSPSSPTTLTKPAVVTALADSQGATNGGSSAVEDYPLKPSKKGVAAWDNTLEKRSTLKQRKSSTVRISRVGSSLRSWGSVALRGTIFNLDQNPFIDFPELGFSEFPPSNLLLDKRQTKERDLLIAELKVAREKAIASRDEAFIQQRKREEKMMKEFQEEMNERARHDSHFFMKQHKQAQRERKELNEPMPKEEAEKKVQEFEDSVARSLEQSESELESRMIKVHLKWILPWFQTLKAMELLHHTQLHALEAIHIEEIHREDRLLLQAKEAKLAKLDREGFEKELKGTIKERKKANRSMSKEEIEWEREVFEQSQYERFEENMRRLGEEHARFQEQLESDQRDQIAKLLARFDLVLQDILGMGSSEAEAATVG